MLTKLTIDLCATLVHIFFMPVATVPRKARKEERIVARVSPQDKAVIAHAAALAGQSVGSFILAEARRAALKTIDNRERIVLNVQESRRFVEALLAPARKIPARLQRAKALHRKTVQSDV